MPSRPITTVLTVLGPCCAGAALASGFADVTASAGVGFVQVPAETVPIGAGALWLDFDGDRDPDLFALQAVGCNRLFENRGDGTFDEVADAAGAADCDSISHGAAAADYDADGDQDLYLTCRGQNRLLQNQLRETGDAVFVDVTAAAGMADDGGGSSASAAWGDYDGDGWLDLFVSNHADSLAPPTPLCRPNLLWRNRGDGTFEPLAEALGVAGGGEAGEESCALAAAWSDVEGDGDGDLLVIDDFGAYPTLAPNLLWRNDGPAPPAAGSPAAGSPAADDPAWLFTDQSAATGFDFAMSGMGIALGDPDRDGDFDAYLTNIGANVLARRDSGVYVDVAAESGTLGDDVETYGGKGLVSWGALFADFDHDGWEDLAVAHGGAPQQLFPGMFGHDYQHHSPVYLYLNQSDGTFLERHAELGLERVGMWRSAAAADYDGDGDLDLYFGNLEGEGALYRNDLEKAGGWLQVLLTGAGANRDAIGSRIELEAGGALQVRELRAGSSFLARHQRLVHFGLGDAERIDRLVVLFPGGERVERLDLAPDQLLEIAASRLFVDGFESGDAGRWSSATP